LPETTVTAVVLRRADAGENDRRLTLFTREQGKLDVVAKGARKGGSRLAGASEPLMVARIHLASGRVRRFVTQAEPVSSLPAVRADYSRLVCGLAIVELVGLHVPYEAPSPELFDDLLTALGALGGEAQPSLPLAWFAARLLVAEGQMPHWGQCAVTGKPLRASSVWYSPTAGGPLSEQEAQRFGDRRRVSAETLALVASMGGADVPPGQSARADEACAVLLHLWQGVLDAQLPAWQAAVYALRGSGE
jgi:DNA repair protein RecO (recombination protein O)